MLELSILDFIQTLRNSLWDYLMVTISTLGDHGQVWILIALVLVALKNKKDRWCGVHILLALAANILIVNMCLKPWIGRVRPFTFRPDLILLVQLPKDGSFPSGHTSSSFAAATAIYLYNKKWGMLALVFAGFMGISRMYLYVHYPTDVAAGAVIGIAEALLAENVIKLFQQDPKPM